MKQSHPLRGPILFASFVILLAILLVAGGQAVNVYYNVQINETQKNLLAAQEKIESALKEFDQFKADAVGSTTNLRDSLIGITADLKKKGIAINAKLVTDLQSIGFEKEPTQ